MAVETAVRTGRQSIKVSERTGRLLRVLAALDDSSQAEIADAAVARYVEERKKALKGRLGEVQKLLDEGGDVAAARAYGKKIAAHRR